MVSIFECVACKGHVNITSEHAYCEQCQKEFTITDGVVEFVKDLWSEEESQTIDAFGWQWNHTMTGHTIGSKQYSSDLFFSRYPLTKQEFIEIVKDKVILDPAVGSGRVEHIFAQYAKHIYANDLSNAVYTARKNLTQFGFNHITYSRSDMQNLPFKDESFDVVICHAILQHVASPQKALEQMVSKLVRGGVLLYDLYKKAAPIRDFADDFVRSKVSHLPPQEAYDMIMQISRLGESLRSQNIKITVPCDIPMLEIEAGEYDLQRFLYYKLLKCFWNDEMSLEENHIVNFDWYYPKISPRFTEEEALQMLETLPVKLINKHVTEGGIGLMVQKI